MSLDEWYDMYWESDYKNEYDDHAWECLTDGERMECILGAWRDWKEENE